MKRSEQASAKFVASEETAQTILRYAEIARDSAKTDLETDLDYSIESLRKVDWLIETYFSEGPILEGTLHGFSAYAGECVRRALDGRWGMRGDELALAIGSEKIACCFPVRWLEKCFSDGSRLTEQVMALVNTLKSQGFELPEVHLTLEPIAAPTSGNAADAEPVRTHGSALNEVLRENGVLPSEEPEAEVDLDAANIELAPFLLPAVIRLCGETIGRSQLDAFFSKLHSAQGSDTALISKLARSALLNAELGVEVGSSLGIEELKLALYRIPQLLQSQHPDEKDAVLSWLLALAETLVDSRESPGFRAIEFILTKSSNH